MRNEGHLQTARQHIRICTALAGAILLGVAAGCSSTDAAEPGAADDDSADLSADTRNGDERSDEVAAVVHADWVIGVPTVDELTADALVHWYPFTLESTADLSFAGYQHTWVSDAASPALELFRSDDPDDPIGQLVSVVDTNVATDGGSALSLNGAPPGNYVLVLMADDFDAFALETAGSAEAFVKVAVYTLLSEL
jgi:hypothetical protein